MDYLYSSTKQYELREKRGIKAWDYRVDISESSASDTEEKHSHTIFEHLSAKLLISRLPRDLTESTVLRNIGVPIGHTLIALKSLEKGLGKLELINADLENNWAVVAEAIQTILRREAYPNPYETLKELTRKNEKVTADTIATFIDSLKVNDDIKQELKVITPFNYTGV